MARAAPSRPRSPRSCPTPHRIPIFSPRTPLLFLPPLLLFLLLLLLLLLPNSLRPQPSSSSTMIDRCTSSMLQRTLEREGWQVDQAQNGKVGLAKLDASVPALILLDLMMPEMDGFEFLEALRRRENGNRVPVIVITAKDLTEADRR